MLSQPIGTLDFVVETNGGVEFETPVYTNNMFGISFSDDPFPATNTNIDTEYSRTLHLIQPFDTYSKTVRLDHDTAAAEDFSFMRFQGAPCYEIP